MSSQHIIKFANIFNIVNSTLPVKKKLNKNYFRLAMQNVQKYASHQVILTYANDIFLYSQ